VFSGIAQKLDEEQLLELKKGYEARVAHKFPVRPQLRTAAVCAAENEEAFRV
jgi:hypothetical protein